MIKIKKAVIPVGGLGTRLLPATKSQPKEMLPVGRKPVVQYVVEEMNKAGLKQILFVTGKEKTSIENHFDPDIELMQKLALEGKNELLEELRYEKVGIKYYYTRQSEPLGLADAIGRAEDFVGGEDFVVALGDSLIKSADDETLLHRMMGCHLKKKAKVTLALEEVPPHEVYKYGIVRAKRGKGDLLEIEDLVEKPEIEESPSNLAIAARYIFDPIIFQFIHKTLPDQRGELQITDSIRLLVRQGLPVWGVMLKKGEKRYDIGNFASYFIAFIDFALSDEKYGYLLRQHIHHLKE